MHENANYAAQIANEIAKVFAEEVKEMYNINNIELIDEADVPSKPYNINHKKDVFMFAIVGIIVAAAYVVLANIIDTTIKSPENVEKEFNLPVLASIPLCETEVEKGGNE